MLPLFLSHFCYLKKRDRFVFWVGINNISIYLAKVFVGMLHNSYSNAIKSQHKIAFATYFTFTVWPVFVINRIFNNKKT